MQPKLKRRQNQSRGLLDEVIPVGVLAVVGAIEPEGEHAFGIFRRPPGTGAFETLLHDIAVRTFNLARADR